MNAAIGSLISKREFLTFYYQYRWRLRFAFILPFLLAIAISFVPSPRYKASSVLTVRMGAEYVYQPETAASQTANPTTIPFDHDQIFKSEVAILQSEDLHKEVIDKIGIENLYPQLLNNDDPVEAFFQRIGLAPLLVTLHTRDQRKGLDKADTLVSDAVTKFEKHLDVQLEKESSIITVTFEDKNAEVAKNVLSTLIDMYLEKRKQLYMEPRVDIAKDHEKEARQHLVAAETALENFKRNHNILAFDAEEQELLQQRSDLQRQTAKISSPALNEEMQVIVDKITALNKDEAQFKTLSHDATVAEEEYGVFAHQLSEATAYEDVEREQEGSVRVIQPPSVPSQPKDIQLIIIACGFLLSLMTAAAVAVMTDFMRSGFVTPEQLAQATGLPVLVALPQQKRRRR